MSAAVSTGSFEGSDVDGLDKVARDCTEAAQVVAAVKAVCEAIVAAASIFGPFGAAFVTYLKTVVIPWLTKIEEALQLFSKVLSMRSQLQRDASSASTSALTYTTPSNLPTQSTTNYPTMPLSTGSLGTGAGSAGAVTPTGDGSGASTVTAPPAIGSTGGLGATGTAGTATTTPFAQDVTAITGLVKAIDHLIHPGSTTATDPAGIDPTGTDAPGTDPTNGVGTTDQTGGTGTGTIGDPTTPIGGTGIDSGLGSLGGTGTPTTGDTLGTLTIPVGISPDGTIHPLFHAGDAGLGTTGTTDPGPIGTTPTIGSGPAGSHDMAALGASTSGLSHHAMAAEPLIPHHAMAADTTSPGTGSGGGTSGGGGVGAGSSGDYSGAVDPAPLSSYTHTLPTHDASAATTTAHHASAAAAHAAPAHASTSHPSGNHDGLYSGLGQAAGLGAGAGAIAKASLSEARERAENGMLGASALPFDADSDAGARSDVFDDAMR